MRIVFFGSGAFGAPTLTRLMEEHQVACVVTQPDRPAGRKRVLTPTPIGALAGDESPVLKPPSVNEPAVLEQIRAIDADAWVVIAFGQKLSRALLEDRFAINLHASLLPRWRGAAPINHAVMAGDEITGNSVITLVDRMDAGLVLGRSERRIETSETAGELHDLLAGDGPELVMQILEERKQGVETYEQQDESAVTLAGKLSRADAWVDFSQDADACRARIHGLTPWPGVTLRIDGASIKALRVESAQGDAEEECGRLIDPSSGLISCSGGSAIRLLEAQAPGGRAMPWAELLRGRAFQSGATVESESKPC